MWSKTKDIKLYVTFVVARVIVVLEEIESKITCHMWTWDRNKTVADDRQSCLKRLIRFGNSYYRIPSDRL